MIVVLLFSDTVLFNNIMVPGTLLTIRTDYFGMMYIRLCKSIGRRHRVSPAGLPIEQVLGQCSLS